MTVCHKVILQSKILMDKHADTVMTANVLTTAQRPAHGGNVLDSSSSHSCITYQQVWRERLERVEFAPGPKFQCAGGEVKESE